MIVASGLARFCPANCGAEPWMLSNRLTFPGCRFALAAIPRPPTSANLHPGKVSLFESIHGSAPQFAGQNRANPLATIMAVSMMLDYLGEKGAAQRVEDAVVRLLRSRRLPDLGMDSGFGTDQVGDLVLAELAGAAAGR